MFFNFLFKLLYLPLSLLSLSTFLLLSTQELEAHYLAHKTLKCGELGRSNA